MAVLTRFRRARAAGWPARTMVAQVIWSGKPGEEPWDKDRYGFPTWSRIGPRRTDYRMENQIPLRDVPPFTR